MPKQHHTEIVCIIDRSGSMSGLRHDAVVGFNTFLASQQRQPGTASLSLILFNHRYERVCENVPVDAVEPLSVMSYAPNGNTALLDAVGRTIDDVGKRLADTPEPDRPEKLLVCILTDGLENSSLHYRPWDIKSRIEHQRLKYSWEFVYLAAGQEVFDEAKHLGIAPEFLMQVGRTPIGMTMAFNKMDDELSFIRRNGGEAQPAEASPKT